MKPKSRGYYINSIAYVLYQQQLNLTLRGWVTTAPGLQASLALTKDTVIFFFSPIKKAGYFYQHVPFNSHLNVPSEG